MQVLKYLRILKNFIDEKKDIDKVLKIERKTGKIESLKIRKSLS